jgi:hypothetical protein
MDLVHGKAVFLFRRCVLKLHRIIQAFDAVLQDKVRLSTPTTVYIIFHKHKMLE